MKTADEILQEKKNRFSHTAYHKNSERLNDLMVLEAMNDFAKQFDTTQTEKQKEELYVWDGINDSLEKVDSMEEAKAYIRECIDDTDGIHPDIEELFIVKKIASVSVEETGKTTILRGEVVPVCKVIIE